MGKVSSFKRYLGDFYHTVIIILAWTVLNGSEDLAIDALTAGCEACQDEQCDFTVGFGGSPDENGETTLDGMIFDGDTMDMGAVAGLRDIKNAIKVARYVLERTEHSLLVGSLATQFAKGFEFPKESLATNYSRNLWKNWKLHSCQPNFWKVGKDSFYLLAHR
nr:unnamed protein product [Callosobruchus analis]